MKDQVVTAFLHDPALPAALDLSTVSPSLLADAPDRLLGLAAEQLLAAALEAHTAHPAASRSHRMLVEPLTAAELRVVKLLPTSSYAQIAATLYVSRNTVKTHIRSIYQKLEVASRSQALERAADLRLL